MKGSVRIVLPPNFYYKGFSSKVILKGAVIRSIITRQRYTETLGLSLNYRAFRSASAATKKKKIITSKHLLGPVSPNVRHKKIASLFKVRL